MRIPARLRIQPETFHGSQQRPTPLAAQRVPAAWDSLPRHLAQENKKLVFGRTRENARARDFRSTTARLAQARIATKVRRVAKPGTPLAAYADSEAFTPFMADVGPLAAAGPDPASLAGSDAVFTEFKGALTEQYVCQQLLAEHRTGPFYWPADGFRREIDFPVQAGRTLFPIEAKENENLRARSLRVFAQANPGVKPLRFPLSLPRTGPEPQHPPLPDIRPKFPGLAPSPPRHSRHCRLPRIPAR